MINALLFKKLLHEIVISSTGIATTESTSIGTQTDSNKNPIGSAMQNGPTTFMTNAQAKRVLLAVAEKLDYPGGISSTDIDNIIMGVGSASYGSTSFSQINVNSKSETLAAKMRNRINYGTTGRGRAVLNNGQRNVERW